MGKFRLRLRIHRLLDGQLQPGRFNRQYHIWCIERHAALAVLCFRYGCNTKESFIVWYTTFVCHLHLASNSCLIVAGSVAMLVLTPVRELSMQVGSRMCIGPCPLVEGINEKSEL